MPTKLFVGRGAKIVELYFTSNYVSIDVESIDPRILPYAFSWTVMAFICAIIACHYTFGEVFLLLSHLMVFET